MGKRQEKKQERKEKRDARREAREQSKSTDEAREQQYELAREVETEKAREEKGVLIDELASEHLDYTDTAKGTSEYTKEETSKYPYEDMSPKAQAAYNTFHDQTMELSGTFKDDLQSRLTHIGLIHTNISKPEGGHSIVEKIDKAYKNFVYKVGFQYQRELFIKDQEYQSAQNPDEDYYFGEYEDMGIIADDIMGDYDATVRILLKMAGSQSGADEFIDAEGDWTELSQFHENGLSLMQRITPPDSLVRNLYNNPNYEKNSFRMEDLETSCTDATAVIEKLWGGETLNPDDYQKILKGIEPFFGLHIDMENNGGPEEALDAIESTGMMTAVYSMNALQRYKFAEHICDQYSDEKSKQAVRFLTGTGVLDIGQAQDILTKKIGPNAFFKDSELSEIRELRTQLDTVRDDLAERAKSEHIDNIALEEFTASNGLLYELVFRFAAVGVVLPFLLNITKLHDLGTWDSILTNPFWLTSVGVSAVTLDHVTGGIGAGYVSRAVAGIGVRGESEEDRTERLQWAEFNRLVGDHPQTVEHLLTGNGAMLQDIVEAAKYEGNPNDEDYPLAPSDYQFSLDKLVEFQSEKQGNDTSEDALRSSYEAELDGENKHGTEAVIAAICSQLFRVKGVITFDQAMEAFQESSRMRGITN